MKKAMVDMTIVSVNQKATTDAVRSKNRPTIIVAIASAAAKKPFASLAKFKIFSIALSNDDLIARYAWIRGNALKVFVVYNLLKNTV